MKYYISDLNTIYRVNEKGKVEVYNIAQKKFVPSVFGFIDTEWAEITEQEMNEMKNESLLSRDEECTSRSYFQTTACR